MRPRDGLEGAASSPWNRTPASIMTSTAIRLRDGDIWLARLPAKILLVIYMGGVGPRLVFAAAEEAAMSMKEN